MNMRTKFEKFVSLRVPEIIGDTLKLWAVPTLPFRQNFKWAFVRMDPVNVPAKFEVRIALPVPEIIGVLKTLGNPWIRRSGSSNVID